MRLEPISLEHEADLFEASRDPQVWAWLSILQPQTPEEFRFWLDDAIAGEAFATVDARTGTPLGSTRFLNARPHDRSVEIGWTWICSAAWGTGANAEAKLLQLEHAFGPLGCRRVEFKTDARNERSRRALEALPAHFEGIHRQHMLVRGDENRDSAWYSVLDSEWREVRENLRKRLERR